MKNVYIDLANLTAELRRLGDKIDYERFFVWLKNKHNPDNIFLFTGFLPANRGRYKELEIIGYKYVFKEAVFNHDESKIKANCDVDIAIKGVLDVLEGGLVDCVLVTSDGDFLSLVKFFIGRKVGVKIISPAEPDRCSYLLKRTNLPVTYLKQIKFHFINEKALDEDKTS